MREPSKGKRRVAHPFEKVIEASIKDYGNLVESERQEYLVASAIIAFLIYIEN